MIYIIFCLLMPIALYIVRQYHKFVLHLCLKLFRRKVALFASVIMLFLSFLWLPHSILLTLCMSSVCFGFVISSMLGENIQSKGSGNVGATNITRVMGAKYGALTLLLDGAKGALAIYSFRVYNFGDGMIAEFLDRVYFLKIFGVLLNFVRNGIVNLQVGDVIYTPINYEYIFMLLAILCHIIPVWSNIKGGKGIAVFFGALLVVEPIGVSGAIIGIWVISFAMLHISSVSAILSVVSLFFYNLIKIFLSQTNVYIYFGNGSDMSVEAHILSIATMLFPVFMILLVVLIAHRANIVRIINGEEKRAFLSRDESVSS